MHEAIGWLYVGVGGLVDSSEAMVIGFSNGGGLATFANYVEGNKFTKGVAIDYWAYMSNLWIAEYFARNDAKGFALKIYTACGSGIYAPTVPGLLQAPTFMDSGANLVPDYDGNYYTMEYGPIIPSTYVAKTYKEWSWSNPDDGRWLKFAVEGLADVDPIDWGACGNTEICIVPWGSAWCGTPGIPGQSVGNPGPTRIHGFVQKYVGITFDIMEWVTPPSSMPQTPPPSPMPPPPPPAMVGRLLKGLKAGLKKETIAEVKPYKVIRAKVKDPPRDLTKAEIKKYAQGMLPKPNNGAFEISAETYQNLDILFLQWVAGID